MTKLLSSNKDVQEELKREREREREREKRRNREAKSFLSNKKLFVSVFNEMLLRLELFIFCPMKTFGSSVNEPSSSDSKQNSKQSQST